MSAEHKVLIDPLFYDALSGPFIAPCDPENAHTLGQIAFATVTEGNKTQGLGRQKLDEGQTAFISNPPWARGAVSTVVCDTANTIPIITALHMHSGKSDLSVVRFMKNYTNDEEDGVEVDAKAFVEIKHSKGNLQGTRPLELGSSLDSLRRLAMRNAQIFVNLLSW